MRAAAASTSTSAARAKARSAILIDGVLVTDPYYGTFDVSTIPITDIVQIRVSTTPQSPIDGPGGPGGVIEVLTRDAVGPQLVIARADRRLVADVRRDRAPRASRSRGIWRCGCRRRGSAARATSSCRRPRRVELARGAPRRDRLDAARVPRRRSRASRSTAFVDDRHYISPPSDVNAGRSCHRSGDHRARHAKADDKPRQLQLQAQALFHHLFRRSRTFSRSRADAPRRRRGYRATRIGGDGARDAPFGKEAAGRRRRTSITMQATSTALDGKLSARATSRWSSSPVTYSTSTSGARSTRPAGVAIPFGRRRHPWPEAKLVAKWRTDSVTSSSSRPAAARAACRACASASIRRRQSGARARDGRPRRAPRDRAGRPTACASRSRRSTSTRPAPCARRSIRPTWAS